MEVHHHAHTARKKWTHYFWEFLMLFLAVFCGFLAEYQLEHKIEKDREKQFIRSLINDIKADTVHLNNIISNRSRREIRLDSLARMMNNKNPKDFPTKDLYYNAAQVTRSGLFTPSDGTLQQLKNAGGLRLIRNRAVTDSITAYDAWSRRLVAFNEREQRFFDDYRNMAHRFFDGFVLRSMLDKNNVIVKPDKDPQVFSFSQADLREFNYKIYMLVGYNKGVQETSRQLLQKATDLLILLKKEYYLE